MNENLRDSKLKEEQVLAIWNERRSRMAHSRKKYEPLWRNGLGKFLEGIVSVNPDDTSQFLYNDFFQQYDTALYKGAGLKFTDLKYPLLQAITMRALAAEIPNRPKVNFVAVGSNDPSKPTAFRHLFNQVLYEMDADQEDFETHLGTRIFGSAISLIYVDNFEIEYDEPTYDKDSEEYVYKEHKRKVQQCLYKNLDLRNVYLDEHCTKSNLSDCRYAQVDVYLSKDEFKQKFADFSSEKIEKACLVTLSTQEQEAYRSMFDSDNAEFVRVTYCFDEICDRYHIIANNVLLNDIKSPIPRKAGLRGKKIPLSLAVHNKIPGAPYGFADSHVTTHFNQIKNYVRMMILEITQKMARPLMAVDPMSPFDEQEFDWDRDFIRISPRDLQQIQINPNLRFLYDLDSLTDNDIIRSTGININDTTNVDAGETARKTVIRRESQNALIELKMNYMMIAYYKRLYSLLADDIRLVYGAKLQNKEKIKVKTKDVEVNRSRGGYDEIEVKGYRFFNLELKDIDFDIDLDLELGNLASSRELDKALMGEGIDKIGIATEGFDQNGVAKFIQETYSMPETVLANKGNAIDGKSPEDLAKAALGPEFLPQMQQMGGQPNQPSIK